VQNEAVTEQKLNIPPVVQNEMVSEQKPNDTSVVLYEMVSEQLPLVEQEHESTTIDDEDTLRRPSKQTQTSEEMPSTQTPLEKLLSRNMVKTGVLVGLLLGVGTGVLLVFLKGEQICQFVLSTTQTLKQQRTTVAGRNRNNQ